MATQGVHGLQSADDAFAVTPNDGADISIESRAIVVTGEGNVQVTMKSGTTLVIPCAAGVPMPARVTRIWSTNTTATGIVVLV